MNITRYFPRLLRFRSRPTNVRRLPIQNKKQRQILPSLSSDAKALRPARDDDSPSGMHLLWRL